MPKKLYIKTYGCQMNVYDSARMADVLAPHGFVPSDSPDDADLIVLNTCHIREKAAEKVYSELGRIREHKKQRAETGGDPVLIAVAGCVAQAEGEEIIRRMPFVDMVLGPQAYHQLPEMLTTVLRGQGSVVKLDLATDEKFDLLPGESASQGASAFLSVQEGCDKFCTFCVVPYTRGAEFSRPVAQVLEEARRMARQGTVEITLLGQNVNAYHGTGADGQSWSLGRLLKELAKIEGIQRLRYTTSHPRDMHDELYQAHAELDTLMPFLHLPVQSGSDRILKAMNRKHTAEEYLRIVEKLRAARPDIALSSDFIVGFPGESDKDFEDTLALVREVRYAQAFSFMYSPRPGTPASVEDNQVVPEVSAERLQRLQALLIEQQQAFNDATIGRTLPILLEKDGKLPGQLVGKSPYLQSVHVGHCPVPKGRIVHATITRATASSLTGELVGAEPHPEEENLALCA